MKQIWWVFPSLPLSKEKKMDASQGTWQSQDIYIFPSMNLQTSGPASGVRRLRLWLQVIAHWIWKMIHPKEKCRKMQAASRKSWKKGLEKQSCSELHKIGRKLQKSRIFLC